MYTLSFTLLCDFNPLSNVVNRQYNIHGLLNANLEKPHPSRFDRHGLNPNGTRSSATAEELRDARPQLKYYRRFLTELLTKNSANAQETCEHNVS